MCVCVCVQNDIHLNNERYECTEIHRNRQTDNDRNVDKKRLGYINKIDDINQTEIDR